MRKKLKGRKAWNKLPRIFSICENCNGQIEHQNNIERRFCCPECYYEWKRKHLEINALPSRKGSTMPNSAKLKIREFAIYRVEKCKLNGLPLTPCIGRDETHILDTLEECFGYKIIRQHKVAGYFLDGYCPMLNLAIEVDEPWHQIYYEKDACREKEIKEHMNCSFLRINTPEAMN